MELTHRPRRLRRSAGLRSMVRETRVTPADLVYPIFVTEEAGRVPITSMPGIERWSAEQVVDEAVAAHQLGIPAVLLFGIPERKDAQGSESFAEHGVVQEATRRLKAAIPELIVMTDVCLCEYTDHGHCGILAPRERGLGPEILNDETLAVLRKIAVSHAAAGADTVAPSGMIDGMVGAIRNALEESGHGHVSILSYAAKYASAFYGPFREAADGAPKEGDRRSHQMDPANAREALKEIELDLAEGADMVMVKPALAYLDVIRLARQEFPEVPLAAYNVSGEYSMIKAAAERGWIDECRTVVEILTGIKRAGADLIISYHAKQAVAWLAHS